MMDLDQLIATLESHKLLGFITIVVVGFILITFLLWLFRQWWGLANGK